jgi:hypothetical protein
MTLRSRLKQLEARSQPEPPGRIIVALFRPDGSVTCNGEHFRDEAAYRATYPEEPGTIVHDLRRIHVRLRAPDPSGTGGE